MAERWRNCRGFPGYKVSSLGRVKSCPRTLPDGRAHGGQLLRQFPDKDGYLCVTLQRRRVKVHHLVLEAFHGARPAGTEGCHGPQGLTANHAHVLRWDSHKENIRDRERDRKRQPERLDLNVAHYPHAVVTCATVGAAGE
jgi:hypothetical protein